MKHFKITCLIFFLIIEIDFAQSLSERKFHPLSGAFGVTLETGATFSKTDYRTSELDFNGRLLIEYFFTSRSFSTFGLRLFTEGGFIQGQDFTDELIYPPVSEKFRTGYINIGGGLVFAGRFGNTVPYLSAGLAYTTFDPGDGSGNQLPNNQYSIYKKNVLLYNFEGGVRFPFQELWTLNLGLNFNFPSTDYLDDIKAGSQNDAYVGFFAGISFYLGKNIDVDNDGVDDGIDLCLDSPAGSEVDEFGCSDYDLNPFGAEYEITKDIFIADGIFTDGTLFCFQIEIFRDLREAQIFQNKIISKGYQTQIIKTNIGNLNWYSLRVGYFNSSERAKHYRDDFFKKRKLF